MTIIISLSAVSATDSDVTTNISDDSESSDVASESASGLLNISYDNTQADKSNIESINDNLSNESNLVDNSDLSVTNTTSSNQSTNSLTSNILNKTSLKTSTNTKSNITLEMNSVEAHPHETITFNATVKTSDLTALENQAVVFKINGNTIGKTTISNGKISFNYTIPLWSAKTYNLTVKVGNTSTTWGNELTKQLTISKNNVSITTTYKNISSNIITITTYIKDSYGYALNDTKVAFKINGATIGNTRTVNGYAYMNYTLSDTTKTYTLTVISGESSFTNTKSVNSTIKLNSSVVKSNSTINMQDLFFVKLNNKINLTANISNSNGVAVTYGKVSFKINGKTIGTVNITNGIASIYYDTSDLSTGIYNISVVYGGNSVLSESNANSILRVQSTLSKYTYSQIVKKANDTKAFIEKNGRLPNYITVGDDKVSPVDFLYLLCEIYAGNSSFYSGSFVQNNVSVTTGVGSKIYKAEYISLAKSIVSCYAINGRNPKSITVSDSISMNFNDTFYLYSRIVAYTYNKGIDSNYATLIDVDSINGTSNSGSSSSGSSSNTNSSGSITIGSVPEGYEKYVVTTTNCEVNATSIYNAVVAAISGVSGTYNQAKAIFDYVNDHTDYSGYYNTRYGAVGTLSRGYGNCVDMAHLVIAMARTANIPARYCHATCSFRSGLVTGHVWAELYVDGVWYKCDATSASNTFGNIVNWYSSGSVTRYISLPF
ncbi:transglutaminase domain-containing protein [Methanosphaera sp.]